MEKIGAEKARIFVANDNISVQMLIKSVLEEHGFDAVETFNDGGELLERIESVKPDLVISDIHMPIVDGFEMLREIHSSQEQALKTLPVILYSATFNDFETRRMARELGASAFFSAPLDPKNLIVTVRKVLNLESDKPESNGVSSNAAIRILILEDDIFVAKLFNHGLRELGYCTKMAATVGEFQVMFSEFNPHLCILDYGLPDGDGMEVLKKVKQSNPEVKVILTTALSNDSLIEDFIKAGADNFISKPINLRNFVTAVQDAAEHFKETPPAPAAAEKKDVPAPTGGNDESPAFETDYLDFFRNAPVPLAILDQAFNILESNLEFDSFAEKFARAHLAEPGKKLLNLATILPDEVMIKLPELCRDAIECKKKAGISFRTRDIMRADYQIHMAINSSESPGGKGSGIRLAIESIKFV